MHDNDLTAAAIGEIVAENARRNRALREYRDNYDPLRGIGCYGPRVECAVPGADYAVALLPRDMVEDPQYALVRNDPPAWRRLRCRHDFEFWAATCVDIRYKNTTEYRKFRLNPPQRRVLAVIEDDRRANLPMRLILLKARQWGGSTLVQVYMAWIQLVHCRNWNSIICAHLKDCAATIRSLYSDLLERYPEEMWEDGQKPRFLPYAGSQTMRYITGRNCRVNLASAGMQEAARGTDYSMAHMSEVAFWPKTPKHTPEDIVRAINGAISLAPMTFVAMESTANGVGTFFHLEWLRSERGESDKRPVFVPWYEIEGYSMPVDSPERLWAEMDGYERGLWERGLTLEMIRWYHCKRREYQDLAHMQAEYPTTPEEAFANSGCSVFAAEKVAALRKGCKAPAARGEIGGGGVFVADSKGALDVWQHPRHDREYIVAVDVGGRTEHADWSVIAVLTRGENPEVVAQWRGHIDHDLLARKCTEIARAYNHALLVIESNTFEHETAMDSNMSVLSDIAAAYGNLYTRRVTDTLTRQTTNKVGFHTNRRTKPMLINTLIAAVRDGTYTERCAACCDELSVYVQHPNGSYAARDGHHDDMLMTRAIALFVNREQPFAFRSPGERQGYGSLFESDGW